jgi:hypothetical protein
MNMVLIENAAGHSVSRDLNPGDHARIPVTQFKSITVRETYPDNWLTRGRDRNRAATDA